MKRRIFLFSALLSGFAVIATSLLITVAAYNDFLATIKREIVAEAAYIQSGIELSGAQYLNELIHPAGHRLTWIDSEGAVLYDSSGSSERMDNHLNRPEIQEALSTGTGESTRFSDMQNEQFYYYAVRLADGSVLRVAGSIANITSSYDRLFLLVVCITVGIFLISSLIASLLTRRIVHPINTINLNQPEDNEVYDEILPLLTRIKDQRKQINEQMEELDRRRMEFAAITENMNEGFLVLSKNGQILSHNKSAAKLLCIQAAKLDGMNILELNRSEFFREILQSALNGTAIGQVVELDGRSCQIIASPVRQDETVQGIILIVMDVTEKQQRENLRREFTANVSHELKTPLTAISGYAEIMMSGLAKSKDIPEFSAYIYKEAGRLIALIKDLMLLSKLEENAQPAKEVVELLSLSENVAERMKSQAAKRNIKVTISGEPAEIMGRTSIVEEMVYNLLDNAIKYNKEGGSATITVKNKSHNVELTVSDTGIGIPLAEQERIFERFYRADKSHNEIIEGTGLGLAIVKHAAMLHDARVSLVSKEEGSSFTVHFYNN